MFSSMKLSEANKIVKKMRIFWSFIKACSLKVIYCPCFGYANTSNHLLRKMAELPQIQAVSLGMADNVTND